MDTQTTAGRQVRTDLPSWVEGPRDHTGFQEGRETSRAHDRKYLSGSGERIMGKSAKVSRVRFRSAGGLPVPGSPRTGPADKVRGRAGGGPVGVERVLLRNHSQVGGTWQSPGVTGRGTQEGASRAGPCVIRLARASNFLTGVAHVCR